MKKYIIKNSDLYIKGKVYPEGSIIELDDASANFLKLYLIEVKPEVPNKVPVTDNIKKTKRSNK